MVRKERENLFRRRFHGLKLVIGTVGNKLGENPSANSLGNPFAQSEWVNMSAVEELVHSTWFT